MIQLKILNFFRVKILVVLLATFFIGLWLLNHWKKILWSVCQFLLFVCHRLFCVYHGSLFVGVHSEQPFCGLGETAFRCKTVGYHFSKDQGIASKKGFRFIQLQHLFTFACYINVKIFICRVSLSDIIICWSFGKSNSLKLWIMCFTNEPWFHVLFTWRFKFFYFWWWCYLAKVDLCTSMFSASNVLCLLHSHFLWYIFCQLGMVDFHPSICASSILIPFLYPTRTLTANKWNKSDTSQKI